MGEGILTCNIVASSDDRWQPKEPNSCDVKTQEKATEVHGRAFRCALRASIIVLAIAIGFVVFSFVWPQTLSRHWVLAWILPVAGVFLFILLYVGQRNARTECPGCNERKKRRLAARTAAEDAKKEASEEARERPRIQFDARCRDAKFLEFFWFGAIVVASLSWAVPPVFGFSIPEDHTEADLFFWLVGVPVVAVGVASVAAGVLWFDLWYPLRTLLSPRRAINQHLLDPGLAWHAEPLPGTEQREQIEKYLHAAGLHKFEQESDSGCEDYCPEKKCYEDPQNQSTRDMCRLPKSADERDKRDSPKETIGKRLSDELTIIDGKAQGLLQLNSVLLAVAGILGFTEFKPGQWAYLPMFFAVTLSLTACLLCLDIYWINWTHKQRPEDPNYEFYVRFVHLRDRRTRTFRAAWMLSLGAVITTAGMILPAILHELAVPSRPEQQAQAGGAEPGAAAQAASCPDTASVTLAGLPRYIAIGVRYAQSVGATPM